MTNAISVKDRLKKQAIEDGNLIEVGTPVN
jgi:hypothetical protein